MSPIVIVQWNLPVGGKHAARAEAMRRSRAWHDTRLALWQRWTLPSLLRQTCPDFEVWLLCDIDPSLAWQVRELEATLPDHGGAIAGPRFRAVTDWAGQASLVHGDGGPVTICRLDSDDMAHPLLVGLLDSCGSAAVATGRRYVQAAEGYILDVGTRRLRRFVNPSPAFFAGVFSSAECVAGLPCGPDVCINHSRVAREALRLVGVPLFCVTLSGTNISRQAAWAGDLVEGPELERARKDYGL